MYKLVRRCGVWYLNGKPQTTFKEALTVVWADRRR